MGFSVSLYAVFDREVDEIQRELGLRPEGEPEDFPDSPITGAVARSGAYILYVNDRIEWGEDVIRPLLEGPNRTRTKLLGCTVNETVMYSSAWLWAEGEEVWSVIHDAQQGLLHLETCGDLPAVYDSIRDEKLAAQAGDEGVDHVFDVPVELFVCCGGVWYNQDIDSDEERPWQPLVRVAKYRRLWWPFRKSGA